MSNSSSSSSSSTGGIGFLGALAILFITLKLLGYIDWSWWWVLAPIWGGIAFAIVVVLGVLGFFFWKEWRDDRRRIARRR